MANEEQLAIVRQGVAVWNAWREEHSDVRPDLRGADLRKADLSWAHFREANLRAAHLSRAHLRAAHLSGADLSGADLSGADLSGADLSGADLSWANLRAAHLSRAHLRAAHLSRANLRAAHLSEADLSAVYLRDANLSGAYLSRANLSETILSSTVFATVDLSTVTGLDTVQHFGPSAISTDTLYLSHGKIPEAFLRGCGVPDALIEYLPSLLGAIEPIQFYSCFISYSAKDEAFARRLHERMRAEHLRVWFAPEDMQGGRKQDEQIEQAIRIYDKLLVLLSPQSRQSKWVMTELRKARKAELEQNRRKLFPIRLMEIEALRDWECIDPETGQDIAAEVRAYHIPDFSRWKDHDTFEAAFARLLRDLKAVNEPPAPAPPPIQTAAPKASAQPAPTHDDTPETIIAIKRRRLQLLQERQARTGHNTPPDVIIEIEDLRREIAALAGG